MAEEHTNVLFNAFILSRISVTGKWFLTLRDGHIGHNDPMGAPTGPTRSEAGAWLIYTVVHGRNCWDESNLQFRQFNPLDATVNCAHDI